MKLKLNKSTKTTHKKLVYNVNWAPNNKLFSYSDDQKILMWDYNAENTGSFMDMDTAYISSDWSTTLKSGNELLALGSEDGQLKIFNNAGKAEKSVSNAHNSSIICLQWSPDGSTIATGGEDGFLKTWSKQAELRNSLVKDSTPIYSIKWNHDASFILYSTEKTLNILPVLKGGMKPLKWRAHDELILCVDWNHANKLIISGGEDRKYKVWDEYGRNLYISYQITSVITSVSWAPSGEYFAVGSFETIRLCSKTGWAHSINKVDSGGIMSLSWSNDGTTLAAGGGNGSVIIGSLVERIVSWQNLEIKLDESNRLILTDLEQCTSTEIDFRDRLVDMKAGHGYLIVVTSSQCHIYAFHVSSAIFSKYNQYLINYHRM